MAQIRRTSVYMCGARPRLPDAASSRGGLTMSLTVRGAGTGRGPDLTVTFTAKSGLVVAASPPDRGGHGKRRSAPA